MTSRHFSTSEEAERDNELSLKEIILKIRKLIYYLLSKKIIIISIGLVGCFLGYLFAKIQKPYYKAELSFVVEDDKGGGGLGGYSGLASMVGINLGNSGGGVFTGDNLIELMKSRSLIERTLLTPVIVSGQKQTLAEYYIRFNKLRDDWKENARLRNIRYNPGIDRSNFTLSQDSLLMRIYEEVFGNLIVEKRDKKLGIIVIKVNSEDELFAKLFTESLATEVSDFYVDTKTKKSTDNVLILQHQTDSVKRALNSAISGVASFSDANPNPNAARQTLRVPSQRRQVDVQANTAILEELVKNLELAKITLRKETPLIQVIDRPIFPLFKVKKSGLMGAIKGGIVAGFLVVTYLSLKRWLADILK